MGIDVGEGCRVCTATASTAGTGDVDGKVTAVLDVVALVGRGKIVSSARGSGVPERGVVGKVGTTVVGAETVKGEGNDDECAGSTIMDCVTDLSNGLVLAKTVRLRIGRATL